MNHNQAQLQIEIKEISPSHIQINLNGKLNIHAVTHIWQQCSKYLARMPQSIIINAEKITDCDGAGLAFFTELYQTQQKTNHKFSLQNLAPKFQELFNIYIADLKREPTDISPQKKNWIFSIGQFSMGVLDNMRENVSFLGKLSYELWHVTAHNGFRWSNFWKVAADVGPKAFVIIALVGFLIGLISAFQAAIPMKQFGVQLYIANLVGISLVRELGPLMTAVILAGRTASSFSAELGTMKINREIDALSTMGLNPIKFLIVPRIIATTCMTPILNIFLIFFGLIGCSIVMHTLGFDLAVYMRQLRSIITLSDFIGGTVKAIAFGIVIAGIGCLHGLKTSSGASAVGYSTTQAVVSSIIMIIIVDGIFACIYYALGI